jgi:hypothetical protein
VLALLVSPALNRTSRSPSKRYSPSFTKRKIAAIRSCIHIGSSRLSAASSHATNIQPNPVRVSCTIPKTSNPNTLKRSLLRSGRLRTSFYPISRQHFQPAMIKPQRPNQSLQRTRLRVTACAPDNRQLSTHRHSPRRSSMSLSLESLGSPMGRSVGPYTDTTASPSIAPHLCRFPRALPVAIGIYPAANDVFLPRHRQ